MRKRGIVCFIEQTFCRIIFAFIMSNCHNFCKKGPKLFVKGGGIKFVHPVKQKGERDYEYG